MKFNLSKKSFNFDSFKFSFFCIIDLIKQKVDESNAALKREFDLERSHHQKFVKDYARLQQRLDNIQSDLHLNTPNLHRRSPSNISNISLESESSGEKNDQVRIIFLLTTLMVRRLIFNYR